MVVPNLKKKQTLSRLGLLLTLTLFTVIFRIKNGESRHKGEVSPPQHSLCKLPLCALRDPSHTLYGIENYFINAATRALPRFSSEVMEKMSYKPMGVFFSEGLALVSAIDIAGGTHVIESGTAEGQSTEILARFYGNKVNITTIDRDSAYHLFDKTKRRLSKFPSISCVKGDSFSKIPEILSGLPEEARVIVFVDGPKGELGLKLVNYALEHPQVVLVAFHDTAAIWDEKLHMDMLSSTNSILMTSEGEFRRLFRSLDTLHGEESIIRDAYKKYKWSQSKIPHLLSKGNGLWITGKSKLEKVSSVFDTHVHVALSTDAMQLQPLLVCLVSIVENTFSQNNLIVHIFVSSANLGKEVERKVKCLAYNDVKIRIHVVKTELYSLLKDRSEAAFANLVRFYLPALLPNIHKVLWIDVDGLVLGDVRVLLSSLFVGKYSNSSVAAVERPDKFIAKATGLSTDDFKNLGLFNLQGTSSVFNAGFIGINLEIWRNVNITARIESIVEKLRIYGFEGFPGISTVEVVNGKREPHDSQTPLVLIMRNEEGAVQHIEQEWNVDGLGWKQVSRSSVCEAKYLHWSGKNKPWITKKALYIDIWLSYEEALNYKCYSQM